MGVRVASDRMPAVFGDISELVDGKATWPHVWMSERAIDVHEGRALPMEADPRDMAGLQDFGQQSDVVGLDEIVIVGLEDDLGTALDGHEIAEVLAGVGAVGQVRDNAIVECGLLVETEVDETRGVAGEMGEPIVRSFSVGDDDKIPGRGEVEKLVDGRCGVEDGRHDDPLVASDGTLKWGRFLGVP